MATARAILQRIEDALDDMGYTTERARLLRRMNTAQDTLSRDLRLPLRYVKNVSTTQPFTMPVEARPGGIIYAEQVNATRQVNREVELLTVADANQAYPGWEVNPNEGSTYYGKGAPFIIYDPVNVSAPIYPVQFEAGDTLRILYSLKPTDMTLELTSAAFNGELDEYASDLIYYHVMFETLLMKTDQRSNVFYAALESVKDKAYAYSRPMLQIMAYRMGESYE